MDPTTLAQWPRLLREGLDPIEHLLIQANNTAIINKLLNNGTKVVFISSFPRSGNTWMRFLLSDIILQMNDVETATKLPVHPDDLIPEFRFNSLARRYVQSPHWAIGTPIVFVKTHSLPTRIEQIISGNGEQPHHGRDYRALYLYRAAEDALVSFYHFCLQHPEWEVRARGGIDAFCRKEVDGWIESMSTYLRVSDHGFPVFLVSYEWLLEKPSEVLSDLLHWLGLEHNKQMVDRAISNMQFKSLQAMEVQDGKTRQRPDGQKPFFRRGHPGSGEAELQADTLKEIREKTRELLAKANQRRARQGYEMPSSELPADKLKNEAMARAAQGLSTGLQQT